MRKQIFPVVVVFISAAAGSTTKAGVKEQKWLFLCLFTVNVWIAHHLGSEIKSNAQTCHCSASLICHMLRLNHRREKCEEDSERQMGLVFRVQL